MDLRGAKAVPDLEIIEWLYTFDIVDNLYDKDIKEKFMDLAGAADFMDIGDHPDPSGIVDRVRYKSQKIRERDNAIKEFGKELKNKKKKPKKKITGGLEKFFKLCE